MSATDRARALRKQATDAERLLWKHLRSRQLDGHKFRRQTPVGPYVVDFLCLEHRLVIELDGGQHADQQEKDQERSARLAGWGFRVLRFWNHEVLSNTEGVLQVIRDTSAASRTSPGP
jgi:very-short-patch-repair endonuclease